MKIFFMTSHPFEGAAPRYRVYQYLPYLKEKGINFRVRPFISDRFYSILYLKGKLHLKLFYFLLSTCERILDLFRVLKYDIVFIQREAYPIGPPVFEFIISKVLLKPIIYDFDDAIYLSDKGKGLLSFLKNPGKIKKIVRWAGYVIAGNSHLMAYASQFNKNVKKIITPIDLKKFNEFDEKKKKIIIGWIGSHSTTKYLSLLYPVLEKLAKKYNFNFKVIGANRNIKIPGVKVINKKWSLADETKDIQDLTIGVYPLPEDQWTAGKCGFKAIQYLAAGIPTIASPVGINNEIIKDGENGFLARTAKEWIKKLSILIEDEAIRKKFIRNGRKRVAEKFTVDKSSVNLMNVLNEFRKINMMQLITSLDIGGTEKMLVELVNGLNKDKYKITVCSIKTPGLVGKEILRIPRVDLISLDAKSKLNIFVFFKVWYLLKKYKIHIFQSYLFFDNFIARISGMFAKVPIIISGQRYLNTPDPYWRIIADNISSRLCDLIISNSYAAKKGLIKRTFVPENKIRVIHNGKSLCQFDKRIDKSKIRHEFNIKKNEYVIGIVARLHEIKNHELFLNVAAEVLKEIPNAKFMIIGEGKIKNFLVGLAQRLGIEKNVIFTGNREDMAGIIGLFDVAMLTSKFESLPGSIIEYMAMSKPVVAIPVGGVTELAVSGETGLLRNNKEELVEAILELLRNKASRIKMGAAGRQRFETHFTSEKMISEYEKIYTQIIKRKQNAIQIP